MKANDLQFKFNEIKMNKTSEEIEIKAKGKKTVKIKHDLAMEIANWILETGYLKT